MDSYLSKLSEWQIVTDSQLEYVSTKWYSRCSNGWP
jgi:hypothetical protein